MKKIFFANIWTELVSLQFLELLEKMGYKPIGNWLAGRYFQPELSDDLKLIIYSPTPEGLMLGEKEYGISPVLFWAMFPDYLVGWDFENNKYLKLGKALVSKLIASSAGLFAPSYYVSELMKEVYGKHFDTLYLGVPFTQMSEFAKCRNVHNSLKKVRVIWNHMWRTDKGFSNALEVVHGLSKKHHSTDFVIGRRERWGDFRYSPEILKSKYNAFLKDKLSNVYFGENFDVGANIKKQREYWSFLNSFDVGFSTSYHEGFGISMMEQAALSVACVLPYWEVYRELYHSSCLVAPDIESISNRISELIVDKRLRKEVSEASRDSAARFDVKLAAENFRPVLVSLI